MRTSWFEFYKKEIGATRPEFTRFFMSVVFIVQNRNRGNNWDFKEKHSVMEDEFCLVKMRVKMSFVWFTRASWLYGPPLMCECAYMHVHMHHIRCIYIHVYMQQIIYILYMRVYIYVSFALQVCMYICGVYTVHWLCLTCWSRSFSLANQKMGWVEHHFYKLV